jgi:hypothetical protein
LGDRKPNLVFAVQLEGNSRQVIISPSMLVFPFIGWVTRPAGKEKRIMFVKYLPKIKIQ